MMRIRMTELCLWVALASTFLYDAGYGWAFWLAVASGVISAFIYLSESMAREDR